MKDLFNFLPLLECHSWICKGQGLSLPAQEIFEQGQAQPVQSTPALTRKPLLEFRQPNISSRLCILVNNLIAERRQLGIPSKSIELCVVSQLFLFSGAA